MKKRESKKSVQVTDNLDGEYVSPIKSYRDLSIENIKSAILSSRYVQLLLALTFLGAFLRLYNLGYNSLWLDEATTYGVSQQSFSNIWQTSLTGEFHPPLFHWIEHIMLMMGHSEVILRFIPALCGILVIPVFYLVGREFYDRNVGIISSALITVSYFGIFYSQEARAYSTVLLFFSIAILFYLRALRTDKAHDWLCFALFSALSVWLHYYVLIALGVIYLHAVISFVWLPETDTPKEKKHLILALFTLTLLILPLLFVVGERYFTLSSSAPTYGVLGIALIGETIARFSGGYSPLSGLVVPVYFILSVMGLVFLFFSSRNKNLFSAMYLLFPVMISIILSSKITMNPRYLIFLLPVFYALVATGCLALCRVVPGKKVIYLVLVFIVAINAPLLAGYYTSFIKEDWRGFSPIVQGVTQPGDIVVTVPGYMSQPFSYYYDNASDGTIQLGAQSIMGLEAISSQKGNSSIFYVVTGDISAVDPTGDTLEQRSKLEAQHTGIYLLRGNL